MRERIVLPYTLREENEKGRFDNISPTCEAWRKIKENRAVARANESCQQILSLDNGNPENIKTLLNKIEFQYGENGEIVNVDYFIEKAKQNSFYFENQTWFKSYEKTGNSDFYLRFHNLMRKD